MVIKDSTAIPVSNGGVFDFPQWAGGSVASLHGDGAQSLERVTTPPMAFCQKKPVARTGRVMGSRNIARHATTSSVLAPAERTFKEILWILEKVQTYTTGSTWHVLSDHHH